MHETITLRAETVCTLVCLTSICMLILAIYNTVSAAVIMHNLHMQLKYH